MIEILQDFKDWLGKRKQDDQQKIKFVSTLEGLEGYCPIVPARRLVPQWFKDLPSKKDFAPETGMGQSISDGILPSGCPAHFGTMHNKTVKHCPGLQDTMTSGYIIPFWGAAVGEVSQDGENIFFQTSTNASSYGHINDSELTGDNASANYIRLQTAKDEEIFSYLQNTQNSEDNINLWRKTQTQQEMFQQFSVHHTGQYENMANAFPERWGRAVAKIHSVWRVYTPPGYSTLILPPDYHYNEYTSDVIRTLYGIVDTDRYHVMNLFFNVMEKGIQFQIPYSTPLAHLMVFKRNDLPYEVRSITPEEMRENRINYNFTTSGWASGKSYRQLQKLKDNLKKKGNNTEILK